MSSRTGRAPSDNQNNGRRLGGGDARDRSREHPLVARYRSSENQLDSRVPTESNSELLQSTRTPVAVDSEAPAVKTLVIRLSGLQTPLRITLPASATISDLACCTVREIRAELDSNNRERFMDAGYSEAEGSLEPSRWRFAARGEFLRQDDSVNRFSDGETMHAILDRIHIDRQAAPLAETQSTTGNGRVRRDLAHAIATMTDLLQQRVQTTNSLFQSTPIDEIWDESVVAAAAPPRPGTTSVPVPSDATSGAARRLQSPTPLLAEGQRVINVAGNGMPRPLAPRREGITLLPLQSTLDQWNQEFRQMTQGPVSFQSMLLCLLGILIGPMGVLALHRPIGASPRTKILLTTGLILNWLTCALLTWSVGFSHRVS